MNIITTMCKLLLAMVLGFYLNKRKILTSDINKKLSAMILEVTMPIVILCSAASMSGDDKSVIIFLLIAGIIVYSILPFASLGIVKLLRVPKDCEGVYRCMFIFSNCSFMGYPVAEAFYGESAILYMTIFNFGFNILFFTYGIYLIAKDAGEIKSFQPKQLLHPGTIAAVMALSLCFLNISIPEVVLEPLKFVGNITMPLSMLVIGANMGDYPFDEIFKDKKMYLVSVIRLLIMPAIMAFVISRFTDNIMVIGVTTLTMGMPVAASVAMGSGAYEKQGKAGSIGVALSTVLSMITLPIIAIVIGFLFG